MDKEAYIHAGSTGVDLYYVFSLLDYDELPIMFVVMVPIGSVEYSIG